MRICGCHGSVSRAEGRVTLTCELHCSQSSGTRRVSNVVGSSRGALTATLGNVSPRSSASHAEGLLSRVIASVHAVCLLEFRTWGQGRLRGVDDSVWRSRTTCGSDSIVAVRSTNERVGKFSWRGDQSHRSDSTRSVDEQVRSCQDVR